MLPVCVPPLAAGQAMQNDNDALSPVRHTWTVSRVGYRVSRKRFDGVVHSVFARACYVDCGNSLLTLAASGVADGPTTLVLDRDAAVDLRAVLRRGDAVRCRGDVIHAGDVVLDLARARTWRAPKPRSALTACDIGVRVALARARLGAVRRTRSSVLDRTGGAAIARLEHACRRVDVTDALAGAHRFVGWGEGLTPAGDDYLVGLCAALRTLVNDDVERRAFVVELSGLLAAQHDQTTRVAAHWLALAAGGHFNADILRALDAVRAEPDAHAAQRALDAVMAVGATSGADAITGILSGFAAWSGAQAELA